MSELSDEEKASIALGTCEYVTCHMCQSRVPKLLTKRAIFGHNDFIEVSICKGGCKNGK